MTNYFDDALNEANEFIEANVSISNENKSMEDKAVLTQRPKIERRGVKKGSVRGKYKKEKKEVQEQ